MKILVLLGSPRKNGNSATLAKAFARGAEEAGHTVTFFDAGQGGVGPCLACNACGMDGPCVQDDDFEFARERILEADLVCFATPMYYFGFSAQLKTVIDRFYAINRKLCGRKKALLLMTYADNSPGEAAPLLAHYEAIVHYLDWKDAGRVVAPGMWPEGAVGHSPYPQQAYELGKSL